MTDHYSIEFEPNEEGWYEAKCKCGWDAGGVFPDAEDACDALMDHAYAEGIADAAEAARRGEYGRT